MRGNIIRLIKLVYQPHVRLARKSLVFRILRLSGGFTHIHTYIQWYGFRQKHPGYPQKIAVLNRENDDKLYGCGSKKTGRSFPADPDRVRIAGTDFNSWSGPEKFCAAIISLKCLLAQITIFSHFPIFFNGFPMFLPWVLPWLCRQGTNDGMPGCAPRSHTFASSDSLQLQGAWPTPGIPRQADLGDVGDVTISQGVSIVCTLKWMVSFMEKPIKMDDN